MTIRSCNPWLPAHQHKGQCGIDLSVPFSSLLSCTFFFLFFLFFCFLFFGHTANGTGCQSTIQSVSLISSSLRTLVQQPSSHDNNRSSLSHFLPLIRILHSHHFLVRLPPSHVPPIIVLHHIPKQHHEHSDPRNFLLFFEPDLCCLAGQLATPFPGTYIHGAPRPSFSAIERGRAEDSYSTLWDHIDS